MKLIIYVNEHSCQNSSIFKRNCSLIKSNEYTEKSYGIRKAQ